MNDFTHWGALTLHLRIEENARRGSGARRRRTRFPIGLIIPGGEESVSHVAGVAPVTPLLWIQSVRNNISRNNSNGSNSNSSASPSCVRDDGATQRDSPPKAITNCRYVPAVWRRPYRLLRPYAKRQLPSSSSVGQTVTTSNRKLPVDRRHRCPSWAHRHIRRTHRVLRVRLDHRFTALGFIRRRRVARHSVIQVLSARGRLLCQEIWRGWRHDAPAEILKRANRRPYSAVAINSAEHLIFSKFQVTLCFFL